MPGIENMKINNNIENKNEKNDAEVSNLLVGYARLSNAGRAVKLSINSHAIGDCHAYVTKDGQSYIPLVISLPALRKIINGERVVTTISQLIS